MAQKGEYMNLDKLFQLQKELDDRIEKQHVKVGGEDRLPKKLLALQVELGELANEWRGFKYWSNDQVPRTEKPIIDQRACGNTIANVIIGYKNPLLEEYVDCLHFILSIGNDLEFQKFDYREWLLGGDVTEMLVEVSKSINSLHEILNRSVVEVYEVLFSRFVKLGEMLGFTWEQIEQAYLEKNKVNHVRQNEGY